MKLRKTLLASLVLATAAAVVPGSAVGQTPPSAVVGKTPNLLPNGGFDIGDRSGHPVAWAVDGTVSGATIVNLSAYRTAGLGSLQISNAAGASVSATSQRLVVAPETEYTLTARLKGRSGTPPTLSLVFTSFENTVLDTRTVAPPASLDWQTVTVSGIAPARTANVSVRIAAGADNVGVYYWDELTLRQAQPAYDPALGTARELFLDDYRIESTKDIGRVVHPAAKLPDPVIRPEHPWETTAAYTYGSVFKFGNTYRLWYDCNNDVPPGYYLCYAESRDGVRWVKPLGRGNVGYKDIPASKTNLIIAGGGTIAYNPNATPERRFALMQFKSGVVNDTLGYYVYFSPDGYTWTQGSERPVLLDGDVSNVTWDQRRGEYVATIKKRMFTSGTPGIYNRSAFLSTSKDFLNWTTPVLAVSGDYADTGAAQALGGLEGQIYGMPVLPYESTTIGLPWVFLITNYTTGSQSGAGAGPVLPGIASSRDLVNWSRPVRDPVLTPGQPGAWDDGALYTASNALVTDRTVIMYYGAFNADHGGQDITDPNRVPYVGQTGRATWRRDGFVSLTNAARPNSGDPGWVTTKPLVFSGSALHLNTVVRRGGSVKVEVLDAESGEVVPGFTSRPITGDQYDATVRWSGNVRLSTLAGKPVKLRIHLTGADLYSYWVK
ncbi:hypothetical protein [Actinophytocola xanthii]|uniref:CBM-cenC domain-containing protein n=1 Tax=Actinophytocola xanthii TaxID=1912961 RepID=A0A1Q8CVS5_9PSEU|nr:hypothetical protein [Actinophytocola xanthii]OLF18455.1 hypothetical protein BU204_05680 [Actinophytocola xanthii]